MNIELTDVEIEALANNLGHSHWCLAMGGEGRCAPDWDYCGVWGRAKALAEVVGTIVSRRVAATRVVYGGRDA
jgi:hypothetical protein